MRAVCLTSETYSLPLLLTDSRMDYELYSFEPPGLRLTSNVSATRAHLFLMYDSFSSVHFGMALESMTDSKKFRMSKTKPTEKVF